MHINWIKGCLRERLDWMVSRSLKDCHARGVDSILFDDTPGARIRLFIANENHELAANIPSNTDKGGLLSVSYHPHHCDLSLEVVDGIIFNVSVEEVRDGQFFNEHWPLFDKFRYQSAIKDGQCGFVKESSGHRFYRSAIMRSPGLVMPRGAELDLVADDLHTIGVHAGERAAWFVYEGAAEPNYENICYSNSDLENFDSSGMYQPMDKEYLLNSLAKVFGAELLKGDDKSK